MNDLLPPTLMRVGFCTLLIGIVEQCNEYNLLLPQSFCRLGVYSTHLIHLILLQRVQLLLNVSSFFGCIDKVRLLIQLSLDGSQKLDVRLTPWIEWDMVEILLNLIPFGHLLLCV